MSSHNPWLCVRDETETFSPGSKSKESNAPEEHNSHREANPRESNAPEEHNARCVRVDLEWHSRLVDADAHPNIPPDWGDDVVKHDPLLEDGRFTISEVVEEVNWLDFIW